MRKTILFLVNHDITIFYFRLELVKRLCAEGHRVVISTPFGEHIETIRNLGCECIPIEVDRRGMNPIKDLKLIFAYEKLIKRIKPDMVLTFTIKPNVYGGLICGWKGVPHIANITGLGSALENGGLKKQIVLQLYRLGVRKSQKVFFQNTYNMEFMLKHGVSVKNADLLPGSGVNLEKHCLETYPLDDKSGKYLFVIIGRLMQDKGTDEVLYAARKIKEEFPNVIFRFLGFYEGDYEDKIKAAVAEGVVEHWGQVDDVHIHIRESHATIHASYHEGMANVLLESAACGRPVIATDIPGCRETFDDGISGLSFKARDAESLVQAIRQFINMPYEQKIQMGIKGRQKMEREFDRSIVVDKYIQELYKEEKADSNYVCV